MAAVKDLSAKIRRVLTRGMESVGGGGVKVRVERRACKPYLNVTVVSRRFPEKSLRRRNHLFYDWLIEALEPSELDRIGGLIGVTPGQDRRFFGNGG